MSDLYGIYANVIETDRVLRTGAKVRVTRMDPGSGNERLWVTGLSRSGRRVRDKCVPIHRLGNFRAKFLFNPGAWECCAWPKAKAAESAARLGERADQERRDHPNRRHAAT